ncbi:MAG: protein kinase [Polyangiales bacterium]
MSPPLGEGSEVAGKYRVVRHLGTGGMGQVYVALDLSRNETVALKVLPGDKRRDVLARSRLVLEGRAAAGVRHPGIVRVHEVGEAGEIAYVAMELLEGEDLHERMHRRGPLPVDEVMAIARALLEAMSAMHEADIIHRDLKPRNLFLAHDADAPDGMHETLKVLDFGIAKRLAPTDAALTDSGQVFGTLHYMAPEQLRGVKHADVRSEIWAAGAILYEALAGKPPFEGESGPELVLKIAIEMPTPLRQHRPDVPDGLRHAIARAMQREPGARYASARDMLAALDAIGDDAPDSAADTRPVTPDLLAQLDAIQAQAQPELAPPRPTPAPSAPSFPAPARGLGARLGSWLVAAAMGALLVAGMSHGSSAIGVTPARQVASARAADASEAASPSVVAATLPDEALSPPAATAAEAATPREAPSACETACGEQDAASAAVLPSTAPPTRPRRRSARTAAPASTANEPAPAGPHSVPSSAGELRRDEF